jgi:hypothetical protein
MKMIKLFRKIRQRLLTENLPGRQAGRLGKYLIYAIGEIILVVIGILIALQINNWNEENKLNDKEIGIAKELYIELNENIKSVEKQLQLWETRDENIIKVADIIALNNTSISNKSFDSIMVYVIAFNNFKLKSSKFSKIIESENFEFKKSKKISIEMSSLNDSYTTLMAYYQFNADNYHDVIQPYLIKNYSYRSFSNAFNLKKYESKIPIKKLLSDIKFDNIIQSARGNNAPFVMYIKDAITKMNSFKTTLEDTYPSITL